jgi:phosphoglycolate phosphatase-like HAD superfamily hydrolase
VQVALLVVRLCSVLRASRRRVAVASNNAGDAVWVCLRRLGLDGQVDLVVGRSDGLVPALPGEAGAPPARGDVVVDRTALTAEALRAVGTVG